MRDNDAYIRRAVVRIIVAVVFVVLIIRVAKMQFFNDEYTAYADNLVRIEQTIYPPRGDIFDRNGEYLVQSRECYDLMVTYNDLETEGFDTMLVCELVGIEKESLIRALDKIKKDTYRRMRPDVVASYVSKESKLRFDELNIPGFSLVGRTVRWYPHHIAGNLLGYIGAASAATIKNDPYYTMHDYVGVSGLEASWEQTLRGEKGVRVMVKDSRTVIQGAYMDGQYDRAAESGRNLTTTIDFRLQEFAEELLKDKVGAVVAIEPSTGEILVMASSPTFNPDDLVGNDRSKNIAKLDKDILRPQFNRAIKSKYPPGSTFKVVQGLIGLQEGVLHTHNSYPCHGGYSYGKNAKLKCHAHASPLALEDAVAQSCNAYFCYVFSNILTNKKYGSIREAYNAWRESVLSFGFGQPLGIDMFGEETGNIPTISDYDKKHNKRWGPTHIISLSIGQGETLCTPLQMANLAAIIANRGYYYIPHVIKGVAGEESIDEKYLEPHYVNVEARHFEPIINGMWRSVNVDGAGTSRLAYLPGLDVCGKTGTAQNPAGKDHSTFISFAPANNPKIAISVYVEHGGWGSSVAVPIASLIEELYLTDTIMRPALVEKVKNLKIDYTKSRDYRPKDSKKAKKK